MGRLITWAPRVIAILGICFISMFALDAFSSGAPLSEVLLGFAIHMIPSLILVAILALAWRFEVVGGIAFLLMSIVPFVRLGNPVRVNLILAGPFIVAGLLFLVSYVRRTRA